MQKPNVARLIVKAIRCSDPPGRFLKKNREGKWTDIGDKKATEKSSQALREKPSQDKKTLQKLTPESVPLYMHGYMGGPGPHPGPHSGPHPQIMYAYPLLPGTHLNPVMAELMGPPTTVHSTNAKAPSTDEQIEMKNDEDSDGDVPMKEKDEKEVEEKNAKEEVVKQEEEGKEENTNGKRKATDFEEVASPSETKQLKTELDDTTEIVTTVDDGSEIVSV